MKLKYCHRSALLSAFSILILGLAFPALPDDKSKAQAEVDAHLARLHEAREAAEDLAKTSAYVFINSEYRKWDFIHRFIDEAVPVPKNELLDEGLPEDDDEFLVKTFNNIGAYVKPLPYSTRPPKTWDLEDETIKETSDRLTKEARTQALRWAFETLHTELETPLTGAKLEELIKKANDRFDEYLATTNPEKVFNKIEETVGRGNARQDYIGADFYFRFRRSAIERKIQPIVKTNFPVPPFNADDWPSEATYVARFEDRSYPISLESKNRKADWKKVFDTAIEELAETAFKDAVHDIYAGFADDDDVTALIDAHNYRAYTRNMDVRKQEVVRGEKEDTYHLTVLFYFNRENFSENIFPSPIVTDFTVPKFDASEFPSKSTYVARMEISEDIPGKAGKAPGREVIWQDIFSKTIGELAREAFRDAVYKINDDFRNPLKATELEDFLTKHEKDSELYTQNRLVKKQQIARRGLRETLELTVLFYFDRETIGNQIRPPVEIIPTQFVDTSGKVPMSSDTMLVIPFENMEIEIPQDAEDRDAAHRKMFQDSIDRFAKEAFKKAIVKINNDLETPKSKSDIDQLIARIGDDDRKYTQNRKITHQAIRRQGSAATAQELLELGIYFYFDRLDVKDLINPSQRVVEIDLDTDAILRRDIPTSNDQIFVAVFRDVTVKIPDDVKDREMARTRTARDAVETLKQSAFKEAADDINRQLAQPMDKTEFDKTVEKASKNYGLYVIDFKWIEKPQILTRGDYSTEAEHLRLSAYFEIDRVALREVLVSERAITLVGKYRTYVELFWNVPDTDIAVVSPKVIAVVIENIEDQLRQDGYEVVEFERIRGDLVELLKTEGGDTDDLYSADERKRFKANLALRNIDHRFENGKRVLADYADLLIGVNFTEFRRKNNEIFVHLTTNATLFERGEWQKLGSSDQSRSGPYESRSISEEINVTKMVARSLMQDLEPKVRKQLAQRKTQQGLQEGSEREFALLFDGVDKERFDKIKRALRQGSKWKFETADLKKRTIYVSYEGKIDALADFVQMYLDLADMPLGSGEYTAGRNLIVFGGN